METAKSLKRKAMRNPAILFDEATHTYTIEGKKVPSVTEILAPLHRTYSKVNPSVLEYAANRGKAVHEALELMDYGEEAEVSPEIAGYINAYEDWKAVYRPQWTFVEAMCAGLMGNFAGTVDRFGMLLGNSRPAVVDIKTSNPSKEALVSVCCQTAAYAMAIHGLTWAQYDRYGLFLKPDGTWRFLDCDEYEQKYKFEGGEIFCRLLDDYTMITEALATRKKK